MISSLLNLFHQNKYLLELLRLVRQSCPVEALKLGAWGRV